MTAFRRLVRRRILALHAEPLAEHAGIPGIRDEGLLEAALARPERKADRGAAGVAVLAAAQAHGIARDHPLLDGTKRTAYLAMELFLIKNGCPPTVSDEDAA